VKIKVTAPNGHVVEAEGTPDECAELLAAFNERASSPCSPSPMPIGPTTIPMPIGPTTIPIVPGPYTLPMARPYEVIITCEA